MYDWIKKMNEMFEENCYTDGCRVLVGYEEVTNVIVVQVLNQIEIIDTNKREINELTEYGLMYAVLDKVREMYDRR